MKKFWFPILIIIILALGTAASIWWMITADRYDDNFGIGLLIFFSGGLLLAHLIAWPCIYGGGIITLAELRAFYDKTKKSYVAVITRTEEVEIKAVKELSIQAPQVPIKLAELAYQQISQTVSERLRELRDQIKWRSNVKNFPKKYLRKPGRNKISKAGLFVFLSTSSGFLGYIKSSARTIGLFTLRRVNRRFCRRRLFNF